MLDKLTYTYFTSLLNETFLIDYQGDDPLEVKLIEVNQIGSVAEEQRQSFSLIFRSNEQDRYLIQSIYRFENEKTEPLDLFIVPLGPDKDGMLYEVLFT